MKTVLFAFLISSSAMASNCFIRTTELETKEVNLAREICITNIDVQLDVFGGSKANLTYNKDGVETTRTVSLNRTVSTSADRVTALIPSLDSDSEGGGCGYLTRASADAVLEIKRDGSSARITSIEGKVTETSDNCHSNEKVVQVIEYFENR
jgi:hypothetical protein